MMGPPEPRFVRLAHIWVSSLRNRQLETFPGARTSLGDVHPPCLPFLLPTEGGCSALNQNSAALDASPPPQRCP